MRPLGALRRLWDVLLPAALVFIPVQFIIVSMVGDKSLAASIAPYRIMLERETMSPALSKDIGIFNVPIKEECVVSVEFGFHPFILDYLPYIQAWVDSLHDRLSTGGGKIIKQDFWNSIFCEANEHRDAQGRGLTIIPTEVFYWPDSNLHFIGQNNRRPLKWEPPVANLSAQFAACVFLSNGDSSICGSDGRHASPSRVAGELESKAEENKANHSGGHLAHIQDHRADRGPRRDFLGNKIIFVVLVLFGFGCVLAVIAGQVAYDHIGAPCVRWFDDPIILMLCGAGLGGLAVGFGWPQAALNALVGL